MVIDTSIIEANPFTYSFVAIWRTPLSVIPPIPPELFKEVLNDESASYSIQQVGITAQTPVVAVPFGQLGGQQLKFSQVTIGYDRFSIQLNDKESFVRAYNLLLGKISVLFPDFYQLFKVAQIGFNFEFAIDCPIAISQVQFLNQRFNLHIDDQDKEKGLFQVGLSEASIILSESEDGKKVMQVKIAQLGTPNGPYYFHFNDHNGNPISDKLPDIGKFSDLIQESIEKFKRTVLPYIFKS